MLSLGSYTFQVYAKGRESRLFLSKEHRKKDVGVKIMRSPTSGIAQASSTFVPGKFFLIDLK